MDITLQGGGGLINMGLTCYGNAVIQALRHLSKFTWILEEGKYNTLFKKEGVTKSRELYQNLTKTIAEVVQMLGKCKKGQSVRPGKFWKAIVPAVEGTLYEQFAMKMFHDSHEFYQLILETIHQSTIQDVDMKIIRPSPTTPQEKLVHGALEAWQKSFVKEYSPFVHMFYGLYHQRTVCQSCKNITHRWEPFNSLKAPIPVGATTCDVLQSLKGDMLSEETIDEYVCEACGPPRKPAKKSMSIWKLPSVLVLSLKRFGNDGNKISVPAAPISPTVDFSSYFSEDSPERVAMNHYTLRGIVDHHGSSKGGHYTAQCRHPVSSIWYRYDDEQVESMIGPEFGDSTYMLFFEKL